MNLCVEIQLLLGLIFTVPLQTLCVCLQMFAATTTAVVKSLGAQGDLIPNKNANERIETLTLVKVRQGTFWPVVTYSILDQTLLDLLEEADVSPGLSSDCFMFVVL